MLKRVGFDVLFYLIIPLVVWNVFRESLGDYYAILFGMVPALLYTIINFFINREFNFTGIFFLSLISLNWIFNLFSETALQELWNGVYMAILSLAFYLITLAVKKPIGMYFFIDYAHTQGVPREKSKQLYTTDENYYHFVYFTLFLCLREVVVGGVKSIMIEMYGVDGFNTIQITSSTLSYVFTALTVVYVIYILRNLKGKGDEEE